MRRSRTRKGSFSLFFFFSLTLVRRIELDRCRDLRGDLRYTPIAPAFLPPIYIYYVNYYIYYVNY